MNIIIRFIRVTSLILLLLVMLAACSQTRRTGVPSPTTTEMVIEVLQSSSKIIYPSFEELALRSDLVVIGYINEEKQIINTARDPDDLTKPDPEYYSMGQIYNLKVDQYFKGEGPNSINLIQNQGFLVLDEGKQPSVEDIEAAKRVKNYVEVGFNKPYLLFLRDISKYYEEYQMIGLYTGTAEPWIFDYSNPDCVRIEGPDQSLARYFPPQPSSMINEKIASAQDGKITNDALPYPAPVDVGESLCYPGSIKPYP